MTTLSSCGDEAKIWDAPSFTLLEQFNPYDDSITDLCWSHNGHIVALCCKSNNSVQLRASKSACSVPSDSFSLSAGCACLDFSSSSRYLLCACVDGAVHIWDRKIQAKKKSFLANGTTVTTARWNWNDTYFALGSEKGEIFLYNVVTGQASSPLTTPTTKCINQMKYNPYKKSSLVSVSSDGAVNTWDTNTRRIVQSLSSSHQAPATDLAFSPINDCLMVTVGLDKRCVFYDIQNKKPINSIVGEYPLTSVDMMHDGATVVTGTSRGKIYFYDMRQTNSPVFDISAHKSSVRHLAFVKKGDDKGSSMSSSVGFHSESLDHNTNNRVMPPSMYQSPRNVNRVEVDVFSPLTNDLTKSVVSADKSSSDRSWLLQNSNSASAHRVSPAGEGVFSPLHGSLSAGSLHHTGTNDSSFFGKLIGSTDSSLIKEPAVNVSGSTSVVNGHNVTDTGAMHSPRDQHGESTPAVSPRSQILTSPYTRSPPRTMAANGLAHEERTKISPPRSGGYTIPSTTSPPARNSSTRHASFAPDEKLVTTAEGSKSRNSYLEHSAEQESLRSQEKQSPVSRLRNGSHQQSPASATSLSSPSRPQQQAPVDNPSSNTVSAYSPTPGPSSMTHLMREVLNEQFQAHREQLRAEIKALMAEPGSDLARPLRLDESPRAISDRPRDPSIFQAEFVKKLIRDELEELKEELRQEFWCVKIDAIRQFMQLRSAMEAGFQECMINPLLLDEIERLKEENARLRKTF